MERDVELKFSWREMVRDGEMERDGEMVPSKYETVQASSFT